MPRDDSLLHLLLLQQIVPVYLYKQYMCNKPVVLLELSAVLKNGCHQVNVLLPLLPFNLEFLLLLQLLRHASFAQRLALHSPIGVRVQSRFQSRILLQGSKDFLTNLQRMVLNSGSLCYLGLEISKS